MWRNDPWIARAIVIILGGTLFLSGCAIAGLALRSQEIPAALTALAGAALGALTGILASPGVNGAGMPPLIELHAGPDMPGKSPGNQGKALAGSS